MYFLFFGGLISTLLTLLFLFGKIKVSIHMIGISSLTGFVIGLSIQHQINFVYIISFLILMNGIVAASRLVMKAHTSKELVIGFFIGLLPQLCLWFIN